MNYQDILSRFQKSLTYHIRMMKLDYLNHQFSAEVYQYYFDLAHDIWEKNEAMDKPISDDTDANKMMFELYEEVEKTKDELKEAIKSEEDEWAKNMLIGKLDSLQQLCAKLDSLVK